MVRPAPECKLCLADRLVQAAKLQNYPSCKSLRRSGLQLGWIPFSLVMEATQQQGYSCCEALHSALQAEQMLVVLYV